ncbi:hypothetical protein [Saccharothrix deserti]|uniref:hypothetical protein n=1 Tax=Saccharothrix deserti TaxID=2593674 RepID=UPI00131C5A82|nr:hypothetical protein [Saccharothrix deserti]
MSDPGVPQRFLDLVRRSRPRPDLAERGIVERLGPSEDAVLEAGQVWRARWERTVVLLLVTEVGDLAVQAAPLTVDPPAEDSESVVVDSALTALGVEVTVWLGLVSEVPLRVLERQVDSWSEDLISRVSAAARSPEDHATGDVRAGRAIEDDHAPDALVRAELADELDTLREVPGLPVETSDVNYRPLASLLGSKIDLKALREALRLPQPDVMQIVRGKFPLTPELVEKISRATGLTTAVVARSTKPLPLGLVVLVEHPRWRPVLAKRAKALDVDEMSGRLSAGYGTFALATRETGGGEPDWEGRLRAFLLSETSGAEHR